MQKQKKLLVATKNPGKFREISEVLDGTGFELIFLGDLVFDDGDFVEDGETFRENAFKKAKYYFLKAEMPVLAEDSGIIVEALKGELGVKTRRWGAGANVSDDEWVEYFLRRMENEENRNAEFICCACIIFNENEKEFFDGETRGKISKKLLTPIIKGLPLSSCFVPDGFEKAYAELSTNEKNKVSHRGKALHKVRDFLISRG